MTPHDPRLIVLSGLPGTGKSAIADGLGQALGVAVFSVDPIESAMLRAGIERSFETGLAAYLVVEALADQSLGSGLDAIVDAVNAVDEARAMWRALAKKHRAQLLIIECTHSGPAVHEARLLARERGLALPEPSWDSVQRRREEWMPWPEPHLVLDAADLLDGNVAKAVAFAEGDASSAAR
jgi:predicted kinase